MLKNKLGERLRKKRKVDLIEKRKVDLIEKRKEVKSKNEILRYKESIVNLVALKRETKLISLGDEKDKKLIRQLDGDIKRLRRKIDKKS